jgi:RNA polymerase sigma factor (sigma-70 family)
MTKTIKSLIKEFKNLKQQKRDITIHQFVDTQPHSVRDKLASGLYFEMFRAWVERITTRRVFDWMREKGAIKRGGGAVIESLDDTTAGDNPFINRLISPDKPDEDMERVEIIQAFEHLAEKQQQLCFLYYVDGYNDREIGEMLKMKTNTVTVERRRGAKELTEILRRWGYR